MTATEPQLHIAVRPSTAATVGAEHSFGIRRRELLSAQSLARTLTQPGKVPDGETALSTRTGATSHRMATRRG